MERDYLEKQAACNLQSQIAQGQANRAQQGRDYPAPPSRGLCQEASEIQAMTNRLEDQMRLLRERLCGPFPASAGTACENKRIQPPSLAELLASSRENLTRICDEAELLISKSE